MSKSMYPKTLIKLLLILHAGVSLHPCWLQNQMALRARLTQEVGSPGTLAENRTLASSREGNLEKWEH